MIYHQ